MKQSLKAIAVIAATLTLGACAESPKCTSASLDCGYGAYTEERTYTASETTSVTHIKPAAGTEAPVAPAPTETTPEPVTEMPAAEPAAAPAPVAAEPATAPAPADTSVMRQADDVPAIKSAK